MEIGISEAAGATVVELSEGSDSGAADETAAGAVGAPRPGTRPPGSSTLRGALRRKPGLGALVTAMKRARALGGDLKLCALQPESCRSSASRT